MTGGAVRPLTIVNNNPVVIDGDRVIVDRKFHEGFQNYVARIDAPLLSVHPRGHHAGGIMDAVTLDRSALPYRVLAIEAPAGVEQVAPQDLPALREAVAASAVVYGYGYGVHVLAREAGVPFVACLEYDLGTQLDVARLSAPDPVRGWKRAAHAAMQYYRHMRPAIRAAHSVHVNGYPMAAEVARLGAECLLYLDSRMKADMVLPVQALQARLAARAGRPLRLLYSGRYEPMKGAGDAVQAALECLRRGVEVEMDCYGQGSLAASMRAAVGAAGQAARVRVHDAVPFPELVRAANGADVFVCCHPQSDPSCTYLESMGSGLPIAGYGNRMWTQMCAQSGGGEVAATRTPQAIADIVQRWAGDSDALAAVSQRARDFAQAHPFETEFARRTDALNALLAQQRAAA